MHSSPFTVAGMSSSTSAHHSQGTTAWSGATSGGPLSTSLGDTLSQSRTQYQPGYLMSASQNNVKDFIQSHTSDHVSNDLTQTSPQGNQRVEEAPLVKTKAKMNPALLRGSASDFGMDSMFESSRQRKRQGFADEDAPPTNSVNDIPTEPHSDSMSSARFQLMNSGLSNSTLQGRQSRNNSAYQQQTFHVIIFGYPADKYSVTVEYFQSLGPTTDPDLNTEVVNCFRMGYLDPADAMRAVRKNGEVLGGSWMVGVKWADPSQAEALLGPLGMRSVVSTVPLLDVGGSHLQASADDSPSSHRARATETPTIGTPIKLAPSALAFRKGGRNDKVATITQQQQQQGPIPTNVGVLAASGRAVGQSPGKGMISQVSDLIFGW